MSPLLLSCYLRQGSDQFPRLARVLEHSARRHLPTWEVHVYPIDAPRRAARSEAFSHNTYKLDEWCRRVELADEDRPIVLLDADTLIMRSLDDAWHRSFDVAYTVRPSTCRLPLNAGVVFLRASDRSRAFLRTWRNENRRMFQDPVYHRLWYRRYGGLNQAALGKTLEELASVVDVATLDCHEWNCEDSTWSSFDPAVTRILHVKSGLRMSLFNVGATALELRHLVKVWRHAEAAALEGATR